MPVNAQNRGAENALHLAVEFRTCPWPTRIQSHASNFVGSTKIQYSTTLTCASIRSARRARVESSSIRRCLLEAVGRKGTGSVGAITTTTPNTSSNGDDSEERRRQLYPYTTMRRQFSHSIPWERNTFFSFFLVIRTVNSGRRRLETCATRRIRPRPSVRMWSTFVQPHS